MRNKRIEEMKRRIQEKWIRVEEGKGAGRGKDGRREERCLVRAVHVFFLVLVSVCLFVRWFVRCQAKAKKAK